MMELLKRYSKAYSQLSLPAKAAITYLIVNIFQKSLSFLTSPIFTRLLTLEEYGKIAIFFSYQEVIGIIAMFCLQGGVFNNGMIDFPEDRDRFSFSMLALSNVITVITALLFIISYDLVKNIVEIEIPLLILMVTYFVFQPAFGFWAIRQRYEFKYKKVSMVTLLSCASAPIISISAILIFRKNAVYARLFGYTGTLLCFYIFFYILFIIKAKGKIKFGYWKYALSFNIALIPHYLSTYILSSSDRIMIGKLINNDIAGIYSLAYSISAILLAIWMAINNSLVPVTYEYCKNKKYKEIAGITIPILVVFLALSIILILIAPEVMKLLSTEDYYDAVNVIPPIIIGVFFQAMYFIFANIVYYLKKPKYVMVGSIVSAICNILLNYLLIPKFGYVAAGYTTLFSYMIQTMIDYFAMCQVVKKKIYNLSVLILLSATGCGAAILAPHIYDFIILRYMILFVSLTVLWRKKREILNILKKKQ